MKTLLVLLVFIVGAIIYFTPSIVAVFRPQAKNKNRIFLFNLLLGWTFIGWMVCLVWAAVSGGERSQRMANIANTYVPRAVDEFLDSADQTLEEFLPPKEEKENKENAQNKG